MHLPENQKAMELLKARVAAIDAYEKKIPEVKDEKVKLESRSERIVALSSELIESNEVFPFPGIDPEAYRKLKADIAADEGRSLHDISSPTIDELAERFKNEGMRVTFGDTPKAGNVYIIPAGSTDIQSDSLSPKHLQNSGIREKLEELQSLRIQVRSFAIRS